MWTSTSFWWVQGVEAKLLDCKTRRPFMSLVVQLCLSQTAVLTEASSLSVYAHEIMLASALDVYVNPADLKLMTLHCLDVSLLTGY